MNKTIFTSLLVILVLGVCIFLSLLDKPKIENITPLPEKVNQDLIIPQECQLLVSTSTTPSVIRTYENGCKG